MVETTFVLMDYPIKVETSEEDDSLKLSIVANESSVTFVATGLEDAEKAIALMDSFEKFVWKIHRKFGSHDALVGKPLD